MKPNRFVLFTASVFLVLFLLGGGFALRVGAADGSFRQSLLFAEVLDLVLDNYVDPVEVDGLLRGAYEGMLSELDPNGAFLSPEEVREWKAGAEGEAVDPGLVVLKAGRSLQVVAVVPDSPASDAGIAVGDQIRSIAGRLARDLSLTQARRLLRGDPGTTVSLGVLHAREGFRGEQVELERRPRSARSFELTVRDGIAVLRVLDPSRVDAAAVAGELDDVRSRGVNRLLLDLRNAAEGDPRSAAAVAGLFSGGVLFELRDASGRLLERVESPRAEPAWSGRVAVLVNGATAGAGEALALVVRGLPEALVYGESTYGLGAEPRLYELEDGAGLLVSASLWETTEGRRWNSDGVTPDEVIRGQGTSFEEAQSDQLGKVLERIAAPEPS